MKKILVLLETAGIQSYIFGSNQLAQNIGASELVTRVTTDWVADTLESLDLLKHSNIQRKAALGLFLSDQPTPVEVVYAGGGNCMLLFAEDMPAREFVTILSRRALMEAPGLNLTADWITFDWSAEALSSVHNRLRRRLQTRKWQAPPAQPLAGLSVTASCVYTGLPAAGYSNDPDLVGDWHELEEDARLISDAVAARLKASTAGKERLHALLPQVRDKRFLFVYDFNQFGRKDESSYIAVIHTDGNGMGNRFENIAKEHPGPENNSGYVYNLRRLSETLRDSANHALKETVDYLLDSLDPDNKFGGVVDILHSTGSSRRPYLPFRPLVFGGDDVTFICDGRLGLALAARYIQAFGRRKLADGRPPYARAGVAVVHTHYPFARAYELAEQLAASAKADIDLLKKERRQSANVMDWHFATTGFLFELAEIRKREYRSAQNNSLLMRPVYLDHAGNKEPHHWRCWSNLVRIMDVFQDRDEGWAGRRNKIHGLREALRQGPTSVQQFLTSYRPALTLPLIPGQLDMKTQGWGGNDCGYFDAIEALDFYVSLEPGRKI